MSGRPVGPRRVAVDGWALTRRISPRPTVRVANADAYGDVLNVYTGHRRIGGRAPERPWAVYLAGADDQYRLLCFDLDAKTPTAADAASRDAEVIAGLLHDVGLEPVVCASGPTGGRHVWIALATGIDPATVATLARLIRHICPTLDLSPLSNPATGCVRPPGAPHRAGGHSTVLSGDTASLSAPTGTSAQIRTLTEHVARLVDDAEPTHTIDARKPLPVDDHARLYLPGPRRELAAASAAALREDAANGDASAVLWRILIGAAAARWHHADIAALVDTAPGLEHVRTYRDRTVRTPRSRTDAASTLRRQWDKAVKFVATSDRQIGDDPTFDRRAGAIATRVRELQLRADSAGGRWSSRGGPTDRRVLDALSLLALQAVTDTIEADTRRVALLAGIGRETARTALLRLTAGGWIAPAKAADGPHGAHWTIAPSTVIHNNEDTSRSQADPRPAGAGAAERSTLLRELADRTTHAAHDLFTPGRPALGHLAGNIYARLTEDPQSLPQLTRSTGMPAQHAALQLERLHAAGLIVRSRHGWRRTITDRRRAVAVRLELDGRLTDRESRYNLEREVWAWWRAEDQWMRAPRRSSDKHRPSRGQLTLVPDAGTHAFGAHPRTHDGRLDWQEARRIVLDERGGSAHRRIPRQDIPDDTQTPPSHARVA